MQVQDSRQLYNISFEQQHRKQFISGVLDLHRFVFDLIGFKFPLNYRYLTVTHFWFIKLMAGRAYYLPTEFIKRLNAWHDLTLNNNINIFPSIRHSPTNPLSRSLLSRTFHIPLFFLIWTVLQTYFHPDKPNIHNHPFSFALTFQHRSIYWDKSS